MKRTLVIAVTALGSLHCSSSDPADGDAAAAAGASGGGATGSGGTGDGGTTAGAGGGAPSDPCSADALEEPTADTTYYVAIGEPGADNEACDGLAPTDEGNGHCPFRDLASTNTRDLLNDTTGVRVELRAGTYVISGWDGLMVHGAGTSADERVVLSSHRGEQVILDVATPDGAGCAPEDDPMSNPACVRQVLNIGGSFTAVQGLIIQNGLGYNANVGGEEHLVRCNTFRQTATFQYRSDSLKLADAVNVEVRHNEFYAFRSQAIDITGVNGVLVEENDFHDPFDADAGAVGCKFGATDVVVRNNDIHDLGDDPKTRAFSLGGDGTPNPDEYLAHGIHVVENRVWNVRGLLAQIISCEACSIEGNRVWDVSGGIHLSAGSNGSPQCATSPSGCLASSNPKITGNKMRGFDGAGDPSQANVFIAVDAGAATAIESGTNTYCAPSPADARFIWDGEMLGFAAWVDAAGTDGSSQALTASDEGCTSW